MSRPQGRIGAYDLIERVGEGGMAEVWLARREGIGGAVKSCALKLMLPRIATNDRHRKMFLQEARLALKLGHANIVSVFDAGEESGRLYMALEWIDGVNLRDFSQRIWDIPMRFSIPVVCHIIGELLNALRYAHTYGIGGQSLGIIHRDVSPHNVMISSSGEVKLADFGIARVIGEDTSQMHVKGKLRYMPPEQFAGEPVQSSDLFAVGAILHELLSGQRFREGIEAQEHWIRVLMTDQPAPPLTRDGVPPELESLRQGLLTSKVSDRISTADEALMLLAQCGQWRNSTIELRKMYERYFNVQRRTGLTQGDGALLALPDGPSPLASLVPPAPVTGARPPAPAQPAPASAARAPAQAPAAVGQPPAAAAHASGAPPVADRFPSGLEPMPPSDAEPDAPVFFRRKRRSSGQAAAAPVDALGRPTNGTALGLADTAADRPREASGPAPRSGPIPTTAPTEFLETSFLGEQRDAPAMVRPREASPPTALLQTPGDPVPPPSIRSPAGAHEASPPTAILETPFGPGAGESVSNAIAPRPMMPGAGESVSSALRLPETSPDIAHLPAAMRQRVATMPTDADVTRTSFATQADRQRTAKIIAIVAVFVMLSTAGFVAVLKMRASSSGTAGPDPAGAGAAGSDAGSPTPATAGKSAAVELVVDGVAEAHVKVGNRELLVAPKLQTKFEAGTHPVAWRATLDDPWIDAAPIDLGGGQTYVLTIGNNGPALAEKK